MRATRSIHVCLNTELSFNWIHAQFVLGPARRKRASNVINNNELKISTAAWKINIAQ
jgi:hypothetical protein